MKRTLVLAVVLYLVALAATGEARSENTEARAQSAAAVDGQSAVVGHPSPVDGGADAITIPQMLSYQGKLTDTLGQPVADTVYAIRFRLYAQLSGGTQFWEENQNVKTTGGLFSVLLGSVTPIVSVPDAGSLYLGLQVGAGGELAPRLRIASAAYAYKADTANYAIAAGSGGDDAWVRGGDSVLYTVHRLGLAKGEGQNAILGPSAHTHVNFGFRCTTGLTGQDRFHIAVGGGRNNVASGSHSTIAGGSNNRAAGDNANVAGGQSNSAAAYASEVGGGLSNTASGTYSVVGGGRAPTARSRSTVASCPATAMSLATRRQTLRRW